jgi:hypothetical protein
VNPRAEHAAAVRAYDYFAALSFGAAASLAAWWVVPEGLPGLVAMLLGMLVGIVAVAPLFALFSWILGGFEIIVMSMQIGMIAGMGGPMVSGGSAATIAIAGAAAGFLIQLLLHALDRAQHGEVRA